MCERAEPHRLPDSQKSWVLSKAPAWLIAYIQLARIDRPIGWWLLLLPCWWSVGLAAIDSHTMPDFKALALFLLGAIVMRGAGSTYNDILDRKLDAKVERTAGRPLPSGRVSPRQAAIFVGLQAFIGLGVLVSFNRFTQILGLCALIPVAIYPLMKRMTNWPQIVLGLAFSWGALMGWAGAYGSLSPAPLFLYAAAFFWTIGYDTIYAVQDMRDDAIVGIGSTARRFGSFLRLGVTFLYALSVTCLIFAFLLSGCFLIAHLGGLGFALHLYWQSRQLNNPSAELALKLFRSNRNAGLILAAGLLGEALLRALYPHAIWLGL